MTPDKQSVTKKLNYGRSPSRGSPFRGGRTSMMMSPNKSPNSRTRRIRKGTADGYRLEGSLEDLANNKKTPKKGLKKRIINLNESPQTKKRRKFAGHR